MSETEEETTDYRLYEKEFRCVLCGRITKGSLALIEHINEAHYHMTPDEFRDSVIIRLQKIASDDLEDCEIVEEAKQLADEICELAKVVNW